jgi:hypothetical protein
MLRDLKIIQIIAPDANRQSGETLFGQQRAIQRIRPQQECLAHPITLAARLACGQAVNPRFTCQRWRIAATRLPNELQRSWRPRNPRAAPLR